MNEIVTWKVVPLPIDHKAVGFKWVYMRKMNGDGNVIQYKARLVVLGCSQQYDKDYVEVFTPVAKQTTVVCTPQVTSKHLK